MTTYLQMNGTSDVLITPSIPFDQVVMDVLVVYKESYGKYWARPYNAQYFEQYSTSYDYWSSGVTEVDLNGTPQTNSTNFVPLNSRVTLTTKSTSATDKIYLFSYQTANSGMQGNIYDIKIYNAGVLKAHYDMSTGTVNDQSGNGNNATLTGGTWASSSSGTTYIGSGTSTGTSSVTSNETLILSSSATSQGTSSTTSSEKIILSPSVTSQGTSSATSTETLISNSGTTYSGSATSQSTFSAISTENQINSAHTQSQGSSQAISNDKLSLSASSVSQSQSSAISTESFVQHGTTTYSGSATSQASSSASSNEHVIYEVKGTSQSVSSAVSSETVRYFVTGISLGESSASSAESFVSVQSIISRVTLQGSRELHITLQGNRQLHVTLEGGVDMVAENQNFKMEAGTDKIIDIPNITDDDGTLNLTTCQGIYFEAKKGSTVINKNGTATNATELSIPLAPADTHGLEGLFKHEVWCVDSNGKKALLSKGNLIIEPSYAD